MESNRNMGSIISGGPAISKLPKGEKLNTGVESRYCIVETTLFNEEEWKRHDGVRNHGRNLHTPQKQMKKGNQLKKSIKI